MMMVQEQLSKADNVIQVHSLKRVEDIYMEIIYRNQMRRLPIFTKGCT